MVEEKMFAFVLMPFESSFDDIYKIGIKETASSCGVIAERVDEQLYTESMLERIYRQIDAADFVIADLSGRNANVFYEVGYAHAKGKLCSLLTQDAKDIPFDLKHHRHLIYGNSIDTLRDKLAAEINWLRQEAMQLRSSIVSVELKTAAGTMEPAGDWQDIGSVELTLDLRNKTKARSPDIDAIYLHTSTGWNFKQDGNDCPQTTSTEKEYGSRHFLRPPVQRFQPGGWAQIRLIGQKPLWTKISGEERKDAYRLSGHILLEITAGDKVIKEKINIDVSFESVPF